jgi:hypothetical protein
MKTVSISEPATRSRLIRSRGSSDPALAPKIAEARQRLAGLGFQSRG